MCVWCVRVCKKGKTTVSGIKQSYIKTQTQLGKQKWIQTSPFPTPDMQYITTTKPKSYLQVSQSRPGLLGHIHIRPAHTGSNYNYSAVVRACCANKTRDLVRIER